MSGPYAWTCSIVLMSSTPSASSYAKLFPMSNPASFPSAWISGLDGGLKGFPFCRWQDRSYNTALSTLGSFLVLLQLASGFCVLSLAFLLPVKSD